MHGKLKRLIRKAAGEVGAKRVSRLREIVEEGARITGPINGKLTKVVEAARQELVKKTVPRSERRRAPEPKAPATPVQRAPRPAPKAPVLEAAPKKKPVVEVSKRKEDAEAKSKSSPAKLAAKRPAPEKADGSKR